MIDKFIDHIPKPLIGELHINIAVEDNLKQAAIIIPRLDSVRQCRGKAGVDVPEPKFSIQKTENMVIVDIRGNGFHDGPWGLLEHALAELLEAALVHLMDFIDVLLADMAVEVDNEALHDIGNKAGVVVGLLLLEISGISKFWAIFVRVVVATTAIVMPVALECHGRKAEKWVCSEDPFEAKARVAQQAVPQTELWSL